MKYYGGIDLGGTNSKIGLLDEKGNIIFSIISKTDSSIGYDKVSKKLSDIFKMEVENKGISYSDVVAIGMGIPGPVVNQKTILFMPNFNWPDNLNLAEIFEKYLEKPVFLDNDVNVITLGETWLGAAKGYSNVLGIAIGTGIGAGLVIDGKILSGKNGAAGEIGHLTIERNGRLCGCGKKGCFESYASATGISRNAVDKLTVDKNNLLYETTKGKIPEAKDVFICAQKGDKLSLEIVDETAEYIALGLSSALNIFDADLIVLGGGVAQAGDFLIDKIKEHIPKYLIKSICKNLEIKIAKLGNNAGIYGAAYLAMENSK